MRRGTWMLPASLVRWLLMAGGASLGPALVLARRSARGRAQETDA